MSLTRWLWLGGPPALFMAVILSLQGGEQIPFVDSLWDKFVHFVAFFLYAGLCLRATHGGTRGDRGLRVTMVTVVLAIGFGILDEWRQQFIPGRFASVYDVLADGLGILTCAAIWQFTRRRETPR